MNGRIQRFSDGKPIPAELRGGVVAIGNFDGVHRGHQAVLERALEEGGSGVPVIVLTFEPHPRKLFRPDLPHFVLTRRPCGPSYWTSWGFMRWWNIRSRGIFRNCQRKPSSPTFWIILGISHVVTGFDFHFGKGRQGGPAFLMESGEQHGFGVTLVDAFRDEGAHVISSSRIRELLAAGDIAEANGLLVTASPSRAR
jgi:riboflavin kinase/FMN adenylyltransferase